MADTSKKIKPPVVAFVKSGHVKRKGGARRTKTKKIPKLPTNDHGKRGKPVLLEDTQLTLDNVERYKHSDCRYYDQCLDHAAKSGWDQFQCGACNIYENNPEADVKFSEFMNKLSGKKPI